MYFYIVDNGLKVYMIIEIDLYIFYGEFYISRKKHINVIQIFFRDKLKENVRKYLVVDVM